MLPMARTSGGKKQPLQKIAIYNEFILWSAMPESERKALGILSQGDFCDFYGIHKNTPTRWKERPDFYERIDKLMVMWGKDKTPDVIQGIYKAAVKGNPFSQKLWLEYFHGFSEKMEVQHTNKVEVGVNDVRFIIDGLPEPYREKFNGYLNEIITTAHAVRTARAADDAEWDEVAPDDLQLEADHDAPELSQQERDELAARDSRSVRANVERPAFPSNYQGTARWW